MNFERYQCLWADPDTGKTLRVGRGPAEFSVYRQENGDVHLYLLPVDWYRSPEALCCATVRVGDCRYAVEMPFGQMIKCVVHGDILVYPHGENGEVLSVEEACVTLQFVHCSDSHTVAEPWSRMVEYVNHYKDYISFVLHTGDYCGGSREQYVDFYGTCAPCRRPIYNCDPYLRAKRVLCYDYVNKKVVYNG